MIPALFFSLADTAKVSTLLLPTETLLEGLLKDIANAAAIRTTTTVKRRFSGKKTVVNSFCEWNGFECSDEGDVRAIDLTRLSGIIHLQFLPRAVERVFIYFSLELMGTIDCECLPHALHDLSINTTRMSGTLNLRGLPHSIEKLDLSANAHTGTITLDGLPASMGFLNLSNNKLEGSVDLTALPASMWMLNLEGNAIAGSIDLTQLPRGGRALRINLSKNAISGQVDLTQLPRSVKTLNFSNNALTAVQLPVEGRQPDDFDPQGCLLYLAGNEIEGWADVEAEIARRFKALV